MRAFIIENKGFILNVSIAKANYKPDFDVRAENFLDSFAVEISGERTGKN